MTPVWVVTKMAPATPSRSARAGAESTRDHVLADTEYAVSVSTRRHIYEFRDFLMNKITLQS